MTAQQAKEIAMQKNGLAGIFYMIRKRAEAGDFNLYLSENIINDIWERKILYSQEDISKLKNEGYKVEETVRDHVAHHVISWE